MKTNILYFDDEPIAQKTQANLMREHDHNITLVDSIAELFEKLEENEFQLLILDIMAPEPTGDEKKYFSNNEIEKMNEGLKTGEVLFEKIRSKFPQLPVLIYTAKMKPSIANSPLTKYIRKPELTGNINDEIIKLIQSI